MGRAILKRDQSPILIRRYGYSMTFPLQAHNPVIANFARMIVKPSGNLGPPNFANAVHCSAGGNNPSQSRSWQRNPFKTVRVFFCDKRRCHIARDEFWMIHHRAEKGQIMANTFNFEPVKRQTHMFNRAGPAWRPAAQFCDHRVIKHADFAALIHPRIVSDNIII